MKQHKELPMLAGIAGLIRWVEELVNLISGPLLTLGLGIALVDLLTDGKLLTSWPILLYTWAITQAIGVDAQLVASWDRARIALREHRFWSLIGLLVLGLILAYVAWVASQVFALQQSEGLSTTAALTRLGMDSASWLIQRTALSVALVALAGWTRYHAPAKDVQLSAEEERVQLEADLMLEPLRQQLRAQQVGGLRRVAAAAMGRETMNVSAPPLQPVRIAASERTEALEQPVAEEQPPNGKPPTGPGSPARKPRQRGGVKTPDSNVVEMPRRRRRKSQSKRVARGSVEPLVRQHFTSGMSGGELSRLSGVSKGAASKWRKVLQTEVDATQTAEQAVQ